MLAALAVFTLVHAIQVVRHPRTLLVPGAHLFAAYQSRPDGILIVQRVVIGEGGLVPPM